MWDMARRTLTRLTFDADVDMSPVWTPDGRRVVYTSARTGVYNLYAVDVDGAGPDIRLTAGANTIVPTSVTADGLFVIAQEVRPVTEADLVRVPLAAGPVTTAVTAEGLVETPFDEWSGEVSPSGRFVAYLSGESGQSEIYVRPYPPVSSARWQVSSGGANDAAWTRGGRELIYSDQRGRLLAVPVVAMGPTFRTGVPSALGWGIDTPYVAWRNYDVSPDGLRFLVLKKLAETPQATSPVGFVVVQHWFEELKRLLPSQ